MSNKIFKYFSLLILLVCSTFFLNINSAFAGDKTMPSLIGLTEQEAIEALTTVGLKYEKEYVFTKTKDDHQKVFIQAPMENLLIKPETTVYFSIYINGYLDGYINGRVLGNRVIYSVIESYEGGLQWLNVQMKPTFDALSQTLGAVIPSFISPLPSSTSLQDDGFGQNVTPKAIRLNSIALKSKLIMPNLLGLTEQEAKIKLQTTLTEYGLTNAVSVSYYDYPGKTDGLVAYQMPRAGFDLSVLQSSQGLSFTVQKTSILLIPPVAGLTYEEAEKKLRNIGFSNIHKAIQLFTNKVLAKNPSLKIYVGKVYKTDPGSTHVPSDEYISVYVGKSETPIAGLSEVEVPMLISVSEQTALALLKNYGLIPKITYEKTTNQDLAGKTSLKTKPKAGTKVKAGTEVRFTVYQFNPKVPSIRHYTEKEAVEMLTALGLKYEKSYKSTTSKDSHGKVSEQIPSANTQVEPGTTVKIVVYKFDQIKIPNIVGLSEQKAINFLKKYKSDLKYTVTYQKTVYRSSVDKVFATKPAYKETVKPGDTIILYVKEFIGTVPNVVGMSETDVKNKLVPFGFIPAIFYTQSGQEGKVVNQFPDAGSVPTDSKINLYIGKSKDTANNNPNYWEQEYVIPPVVGFSVREARTMLAANKINFIVSERTTGKREHGKVLIVRPSMGEHVKPWTEVILSVGKDNTVIPNLVGMSAYKASSIIAQNRMEARYTGTPTNVPKHYNFFKKVPLISNSSNSLSQYGFGQNITSKLTSASGNAVVISQDPAAGTKKQSHMIILTLASDIRVPDVIGKPFNEVIKMLQDLGLQYDIKYKKIEDGKKDRVVLKSKPHPESPVSKGSRVLLEVGKLPDNVPDVTGKSEQEAVNILKKMNFYIEKEYKNSDRTDNIVLAQSQNPGSRKKGCPLKLLLGTRNELALISVPTPIKKAPPKAVPAPMMSKRVAAGAPATSQAPALTANIKDFYNKFQQAYQSKTEYAVTALFVEDWQTDDGTTLFDLEDNLRNIFNLFDDVRFNISNLKLINNSGNIYTVSYENQIIGKIYESNITRNEKSSVTEQIIVDSSGNIKIYKTLSGKFWYRE